MNENDETLDNNTSAAGIENTESWLPSPVPQVWASGEVVNYYFPVEVVVAGSLTPQDRETLQAGIFEDLHDAINRRLA